MNGHKRRVVFHSTASRMEKCEVALFDIFDELANSIKLINKFMRKSVLGDLCDNAKRHMKEHGK